VKDDKYRHILSHIGIIGLFITNNNILLSLCFFELKLAKLRIGIEHAKYKVAEKRLIKIYTIGEML
jgi:hypothetical protein